MCRFMKANEIRVGNWIRTIVHIQDYKKVIAVTEKGAAFYIIGNHYSWLLEDRLAGIPLTPEVLEKCGFVQQADTFDWATPYHFQINGKFILVNRNDKLYYIDAINTEVNYLHQLQNLYFALTGTELEYKP